MSETFPQPFGRYTLKEPLALGGMAELFLAEVTGAHGFAKTVVIKRILPHLAANEQFTSMFIAEAKITAQLAHPKIAQTFELCTEDKQLFIVMEYIEGLDVLALLRECAFHGVRLQAEIAVFVLREVLDALDFAHKLHSQSGDPLGIVHRDVSPSNVILSKRGDVKLVDFGIAHAAEQGTETKSGTLKGKYGYMSPEQVLGQKVSPQSDIFAAGVVLAEMLMGRRLFAAANELDVLLMVRDVNLDRLDRFGQHIDSSLADVLRWALRKDPGDRYSDAGVFRDTLDEWLFNRKQRVSTTQLADIVNSFYDEALNRRKQAMQTHKARAQSTNPLGSSDEGSLPGNSQISIDPPAEIAPAEITPTKIPAAREIPTGEYQERDGSSAIIEVSVHEDSSLAAEVAALTSPDALQDVANMPTTGANPAYDTITAAVASVSPLMPDPASRDFDDTDVAQSNRVQPDTLPSAATLHATERPRPPTLQPSVGGAERSGSLQEQSALGVLYKTTAARETGKVVLSLGAVRKEIYFRRGVPEFVSSNIASELFGAYLVRNEVILSGELDMALAVMPHFGGKLGDTLVGLGLIKPLEVFRHLTMQVRSKLVEVCTWTQGQFEWFPEVQCPKQVFPLDLDPLEVYGASAMCMPRESMVSWLSRKGDSYPAATQSSVVVPELFQVQRIRQFQRTIDGARTLSEIVASCSEDDEGLRKLRCLFLLINTQLVTCAPPEPSVVRQR